MPSQKTEQEAGQKKLVESDVPDRSETLPEEAVFSGEFATNNPDHVDRISRHQLIYSMAGLILGLICVLSGVLLFFNGIAGSSGMTAKILGAETTLTDAAPGAILFMVGLLIVFTTRYVLKVNK